MPTLIKEYKPEAQTRILWLHREAFADSACTKCPGNCCDDCGQQDGYAPWDEDKKVLAARKRKYGWDEERGFKGEHGCKLPVTERSDICIGFACGGTHIPHYGARFNPPKGVDKPFWEGERLERVRALRNELSKIENFKTENIYV